MFCSCSYDARPHRALVVTIWETSPEDNAQGDGFDKSMEAEWQKYVEFNAVVPCTAKEIMSELTHAGHVCIPTKFVLTDKTEHFVGAPGYTPKWKARLVACGNFEQMNGEDIPTAEQEGIALICSWAVPLGLRLRAADITNAYFHGQPLERLLILRVPKHPKSGTRPRSTGSRLHDGQGTRLRHNRYR